MAGLKLNRGSVKFGLGTGKCSDSRPAGSCASDIILNMLKMNSIGKSRRMHRLNCHAVTKFVIFVTVARF
jgi:hypothetical protein